jgi:hypothetical protein
MHVHSQITNLVFSHCGEKFLSTQGYTENDIKIWDFSAMKVESQYS